MEVATDDGWTVVTHSASRKQISDHESAVTGDRRVKSNTTDSLQLSRGIVDGLTVPRLLEQLEKMQNQWRDTSCAKQVEDILRRRMMGEEGALKGAVCIGIGSFSVDWEHRMRAMWQLVLFLTVVGFVSKKNPERDVILYAQDPAFNALDISLLHTLHIATLPSQIETHITSSCFVFAPFVDWYLLLPTFLNKRDPPLYIGNEILDDYGQYANMEEKKMLVKECDRIGRQWLQKRRMERIPGFELHSNALNGLVVYCVEKEE
ncbi:hypothetical protein BCR34DRAFT_624086 [Clohesyomyces aquaticus]|uniref:SRR1-like domain-containing protein n=1 Tax=Clohesyomyces aquaticus TaxID=1231657 RepID=A0A1Y1ZS25_9PLEO|nr:hypothetical protein BCR34DRAFT_624086 [Clohesyomyces aquaticus]